jgi:hypothetical protein
MGRVRLEDIRKSANFCVLHNAKRIGHFLQFTNHCGEVKEPAPHLSQFTMLFDAEQLDIEEERGIRRDSRSSGSPIGEIRRDDQLPFTTDFHRHDTFVPPFYYASGADHKSVWLFAINRAVELRSVLQSSRIMNDDFRSGCRTWARPDDFIHIFEPGGCPHFVAS